MLRNHATIAIAAVLASTALAAPVRADVGLALNNLLAVGRTADAVTLAANAVASEGTDKARLALATAQFLRAIERLGNGLYRYGLGDAVDTGQMADLLDLPFLRIPVPPNPEPDSVTYEGLRALLRRFGEDLDGVDATLSQMGSDTFDLRLDLDRVALDLDGDGTAAPEERLPALYAAVDPMGAPTDGLIFDFDQSDAIWLHGYTHMLRAMTDFLLALYWKDAFDRTLHFVFPDPTLPSGPLREAAVDALRFREEHAPPPEYWDLFDYGDPNRPNYDDWKVDTPEGRARSDWEARFATDYRSYDRLLETGGIADLVAFVHLASWPVVDSGQLQQARLHLLRTVELSRANWNSILAESDNKREWIPSPGQTPRFEAVRVTPEVVESWTRFLDLSQEILEGRTLVPHWRFGTQGVNLRRMFEEGRVFDPVLIVQGSAVIPFLEDGQVADSTELLGMLESFDAGFLPYLFWFN